jgi:hypothetical protein
VARGHKKKILYIEYLRKKADELSPKSAPLDQDRKATK